MSERSEYVCGWNEGYRSIQGQVIAPIPSMTMIPIGKTAYDYGYEQGRRSGLD